MKSKLRTTVESFLAQENLSRFNRLKIEISTPEDARELCLLLKENLHRPSHAARLLQAFQPDESNEEVIDILRHEGTPLLLELEPKLERTTEGFGDDRLFLLKLLAMFGTSEGADRVIAIAKSGYAPDQYLWNVIFGCFTRDHPESERVFAALSSSLPTGFAAVSLLDAANRCAIEGMEFPHPFDSPEGAELLRGWLRDLNPEHFSYAHSATAALPFIGNPPRDELLQLAMDHPDLGVSVEAAWASAKVGMERGIRELSRYAGNINSAATAIQLLTELGREDAIPPEAQDADFQAMAEMVQWLSHPNEFGEPPAKIALYDTREIFWPPTNDRRQVWLFRYEYPKSEDREEVDIGLGMVGSITFALFGETTAKLSPMEAYALHCCWELESNDDSRAPEERSVAAGRAILATYNGLSSVGDDVQRSGQDDADEDDQPGANPEDTRSNALRDFVAELTEKAKRKVTEIPQSESEALKAALKEMMDSKVKALREQANEFRMHLLAQRASAPVVRTTVRPGPEEALQQPEVAAQRAALELGGYRLKGVFAFENLPGFTVVLFDHPQDGTIASINCGKDLLTELAAEYSDGRGFYVRDKPAARGLTPPPWATYLYEPGRSVPELIDIFQAKRPRGNERKSHADAPAQLATEFRRVQLWRMERGGWNRDEVQMQMGVTDQLAQEDELGEACLNIREKWLYAWFKDNHPELADELMESLIIVHDELNSTFSFMLWVTGGGDPAVRREQFEGINSRDAVSLVNHANGQPLTLIARKAEGYRADFYRPSI